MHCHWTVSSVAGRRRASKAAEHRQASSNKRFFMVSTGPRGGPGVSPAPASVSLYGAAARSFALTLVKKLSINRVDSAAGSRARSGALE
jgi:hypothetical protein